MNPTPYTLNPTSSDRHRSPYTVYECAELGIPFIAASVGGVPDLVHEEDHGEALFEPTVEELAMRMGRALAHGVRPARPRIDAALNERAWVAWHSQVVAAAARARRGRAAEEREKEEAAAAGAAAARPAAGATAAGEAAAAAGPATWKAAAGVGEVRTATAEAGAMRKEDAETPTAIVAEEPPATSDAHLPFMSVVMTHFNRPRLCGQAIQSIRDQDYPPHRMELVLVSSSLRYQPDIQLTTHPAPCVALYTS